MFRHEKFIFFFGLFLLNIFVFAQYDGKNIVTFGSFAPFHSSRYEFGYMRELSEKWWIGGEFGYGTKKMVLLHLESEKFQTYSIRPEIFYSLSPNRKSKHFVSFQPFYIKTDAYIENSTYYRDGYYYGFDSADYDRVRKGVNINYSLLLLKNNKRFGFMPKIGIGYSMNNIQYKNVKNQRSATEPTDDFTLGLLNNDSTLRKNEHFNFYVDMKFIYKL